MNPFDPSSFNHRTEKLTTGHTYHFVDQLPPGYNRNTPTLLLLHVFFVFHMDSNPLVRYGWRYQIGPWARRGWRIIVPDCLGYGGTDKPSELSAYTIGSVCCDLAALLDHTGVDRVIVIGHDWGAEIAWRLCLYYPLRVSMVACLSIPFFPPARSFVTLEASVKKAPEFAYQVYFADEASTKEIENNLDFFLNLILYSGAEVTRWAPVSCPPHFEVPVMGIHRLIWRFEFYLQAFRNSLAGPLSYYKTKRLRFDEEKEANLPSALPASLPALFVRGTMDPTSQLRHAIRSKDFVPSLKITTLAGAGHWLMVQRKDEVTTLIADWIETTLHTGRSQAKL
ncbi:hypothetical protein BS47DRAFT_1372078 [Hydnum rufescens UP504]|uniref:AB hydrolase-1 domain-containing protein n=1 Tax=Hydnum rufescens UP504 TaxID=1448309 RepID=A0A9P6B1G5_9AGAM|nr:hypothetical protein BS47DRAFT_1372078 [Hydnum rufescens UP504]